MEIFRPFAAGALAVLVFHQSALALLHAFGMTARIAFDLSPTAPLDVPQVLSLAFWGGAWAVALWPLVVRLAARAGYWLAVIGTFAVVPSLVGWLVVAPLKGQPLAAVLQAKAMATSLLVNGAWGLGLALAMRRSAPASRATASPMAA